MKELFTNWFAVGGTSAISAIIAYFAARRKNKLEADSTELGNVIKSIDVYQKVIDDLQEHIKNLKAEIKEMRIDFEIKLKKCYENK